MQNFAELLVNPLEQNVVVLIFASRILAINNLYRVCYHITISLLIPNFALLIFAEAHLSAKNPEFCTMQKFPHNTVFALHIICFIQNTLCMTEYKIDFLVF